MAQLRHAQRLLGVGTVVSVGLLASLARDRVSLGMVGPNVVLDAYLLAVVVVAYAIQLPASAFGAILVPRLAQADGLRNQLPYYLSWSALLGGVVGVLLLATSELIAGLLATGDEARRLLVFALRAMAFTVPATMLCQPLVAALQVKGRIATSMFLAGVRHLVGLVAFLAVHEFTGVALVSLVVGAVIGGLGELAWAVCACRGADVQVSFATRAPPGATDALQETWWMALNSLALGSTTVVDQSMAARFGEASVSALAYGNKVPGALLAAAGMAVGAVVLPSFSRLAASEARRLVPASALQSAFWFALLSMPLAVIGAFVAADVHDAVFGDGTFVGDQRSVVVGCQRAFWFQIPGYLAAGVIARGFIALTKSRLLLYFGVIIAISNVVLNLWFSRAWGVVGIAWSTTAVYSLSAVLSSGLMWSVLARRTRQ